MTARKPCPVTTCTETTPAGQVMCVKCWEALPQHVRVSIDAAMRSVRRQPTKSNKARVDTAVRNAVRIAATVRR